MGLFTFIFVLKLAAVLVIAYCGIGIIRHVFAGVAIGIGASRAIRDKSQKWEK